MKKTGFIKAFSFVLAVLTCLILLSTVSLAYGSNKSDGFAKPLSVEEKLKENRERRDEIYALQEAKQTEENGIGTGVVIVIAVVIVAAIVVIILVRSKNKK